MKVAVSWSEMEHYSSVVDIDEDMMREDGYDPDDRMSLMQYLTDTTDEWKEQCSTNDDFYGSDGAVVTNAHVVKGE